MNDDIEREQRRLRGLIALMRDGGVSTLRLSDVHICLGPATETARYELETDPDERAELSDEERREAALTAAEREHYAYWRRLTRSSGAPIPPFRRPQ